MRTKPDKLDRKQPDVARDAMEDIKDLSGVPKSIHNEIRFLNANRDRALGAADRTGRHYDEEEGSAPDEGFAASENHEAD
jgi:hypothetical protein